MIERDDIATRHCSTTVQGGLNDEKLAKPIKVVQWPSSTNSTTKKTKLNYKKNSTQLFKKTQLNFEILKFEKMVGKTALHLTKT